MSSEYCRLYHLVEMVLGIISGGGIFSWTSKKKRLHILSYIGQVRIWVMWDQGLRSPGQVFEKHCEH